MVESSIKKVAKFCPPLPARPAHSSVPSSLRYAGEGLQVIVSSLPPIPPGEALLPPPPPVNRALPTPPPFPQELIPLEYNELELTIPSPFLPTLSEDSENT